jgi:hypothetical protein
MSTKLRQGVDAHTIARLHEKLAMAELALHEAMRLADDDGRHVLPASTYDNLRRISGRILTVRFGLETPFMRAVGGAMDSPFASWENPTVWTDWLNARDAKAHAAAP